MLARLQSIEAQLLATYRDEAASEVIQALAAARVEVAQRDFDIMEFQARGRGVLGVGCRLAVVGREGCALGGKRGMA